MKIQHISDTSKRKWPLPIFVLFTCLWFLFLATNVLTVYAQYQNIWAFGANAGLDFNRKDADGYPIPIRTNITTKEGVATICDNDGNLLFYSDGSIVYDRDFNVMLNGLIFTSSVTASTTQGALIVPISTKRYYLFSLTSLEQNTPALNGKLYYSIVNMDLNNGMGGIEIDRKRILIDSGVSEQLTNVIADDCKKWLVYGKYSNLKPDNSYDNYNIVFTRIHTDSISTSPVVNKVDKPYDAQGGYGALVPSHDFTFIVDIRKTAVIYKLDANNGKIYEPVKIAPSRLVNGGYYACFSPDNSKLYLSGESNVAFQLDLSNYDSTAIDLSRYILRNNAISGMQLGPDGRIYLSGGYGTGYINVIHNPNESKAACNFEVDAIKLFPGTSCQLGLPNIYRQNGVCNKGKLYDSCYFQNNVIGTNKIVGHNRYLWNTGDTTQFITADTPGTYIVGYQLDWITIQDTFIVRRTKKPGLGMQENSGDCFASHPSKYYLVKELYDTFRYSVYWVKNSYDTVYQGLDTVELIDPGNYQLLTALNGCTDHFDFEIKPFYFQQLNIQTTYNCANEAPRASATLTTAIADSIQHNLYWLNHNFDTLSTRDTVANLPDGTYYLFFKTKYCDTLVKFAIGHVDPQIEYKVDTIICQSTSVEVENLSPDYFQHYSWYLNDHLLSKNFDIQLNLAQPGTYRLSLIAEGEMCRDTLSRVITVDSLFNGIFLAQRDSICEGEAIAFQPPVHETIYEWHWTFGPYRYTSYNAEPVSHAFDEAGILPVTLRTSFRACPDTQYEKAIYISAIPGVFLGNESSICVPGKMIILKNYNQQQDGLYQYTWSTGDTTPQLPISLPGTYGLKVQAEPLGCTGYGTIDIGKDCFINMPNVFTPNGDGLNDYFFPKKWLRNGVEKFHLQIRNRWGQIVYETQQRDAPGWDGKSNRIEQPTGVYIYRINISFKNGITELYEGNLTLMR